MLVRPFVGITQAIAQLFVELLQARNRTMLGSMAFPLGMDGIGLRGDAIRSWLYRHTVLAQLTRHAERRTWCDWSRAASRCDVR